ncbi:PREDICTED: F-box/kelch-repeat protein At4g38940-like [Camelina sativa]|uniref:F-box/kelch-repeat protein At4g38940-like n=1 Tax=Camelina sativa TaxID=90675 RepID=A0ABM1R4B0_CAMSA|nr:PREDICTED: F-box/kelch-repeat protein At4g38940-like [Camelina sativa]
MTSLPEELILDCVARVPRCYHPILSLVSDKFRSFVTSPEIYMVRSLLGNEDHSLYVAISKNQTSAIHWYTLVRKPNNNHWLVPIPSLPPMPLHGSYVVSGSSIYVMGGFHHWGLITPSVSRIDCVSHTVQPLARMPTAVACSVSKLVDGKIYVIGGSDTRPRKLKSSSKRIMVFDTEAQTWGFTKKRPAGWDVSQRWLSSVETADKIYMRSYQNSYVYEPKKGTCTIDRILHSKEWSNSCVLDDVLYYYDVRKNCLRAYDLKERAWGVVKGVELGLLDDGSWSCTVNYGRSLAVFLQKVIALTETTEIWCAQIVVERYEGGDIWGNVEWYNLVLDGNACIMNCLAVKM